MYKVEVSPWADRELDGLKKRIQRFDLDRLRTAVDGLASDPRPRGVRKIKGAEQAYRVRVGDYRLIYEIYDNKSLVLILRVLRRTNTTYKS